MNHIESTSRKCRLIVPIIQSEIILMSIEISIKVLLRDSHRYGGITLKIIVPNNLRFKKMTFYISKEVLCDVRFILPRHSLGQMFRLSHRYSSNQTYIRIFTIGHFEVLRLYGSNCQ